MALRLRSAALATLTAVVAVAGCGGSSSSSSSSASSNGTSASAGTGLPGALQEVSDSSFARTYLEWSDVRTVQSLGRRWLRVSGIGTGQLGPAAQQLAGPTKINVLSAR